MEIRRFRIIGIVLACFMLLSASGLGLYKFTKDSESIEAYEAAPPVSLVGSTSYALIDPSQLGKPAMSDASFRALHDQARSDSEWLLALDTARAAQVSSNAQAVVQTLRSVVGATEGGSVEDVSLQNATRAGAVVSVLLVWDTPDSPSGKTRVPINITYKNTGDDFEIESLSSTAAGTEDEDSGVDEGEALPPDSIDAGLENTE